MKKCFVLFALSIVCHDVGSQSKFGFKLGSGMQTISGCPIKTKPKTAFMGGLWVRLKINRKWTMQAELTNIGKGTGLGLQQNKVGDYWLNLYYFEVPILFQYNKHNSFFEFGPSLAALINSGEYTNGVTLPYQADLYPISKKDFSFSLGTGYVFDEKWRVGLRMSHSLLPVRKQLPATSHQIYNRGIILAVSRQINLKAKHWQDID